MFGCSYEPPNTNLAQMPDGWASTTRESFLRGYGNELAAAGRGSKSGAKSSSRTCIITAYFSECVTQLEHMRWHTAAKGCERLVLADLVPPGDRWTFATSAVKLVIGLTSALAVQRRKQSFVGVEFPWSRAQRMKFSTMCASQSVGCACAQILRAAKHKNPRSALRRRMWWGAGGGVVGSTQESKRMRLGTTLVGLMVVNHQQRLQLRGRLPYFALTLGPVDARTLGPKKDQNQPKSGPPERRRQSPPHVFCATLCTGDQGYSSCFHSIYLPSS
ncbi:hypothetical protein HPB51_019402 [Rhipicephalus microplus]|uniref:Uncharacterized protein n=1 Tax=Rhipicephalus microplus TaxID=6941 RepID=A0A9J6DB86_RHIMP|nr:hypothetical protein HPB51_019402 [Rhipicephalus microplus]